MAINHTNQISYVFELFSIDMHTFLLVYTGILNPWLHTFLLSVITLFTLIFL